LKRKLVDFSSNRRFFYLPGACLPFSGKPGYSFLINPIFLSGALVLINRRVNSGEPGETGTGGAHKSNRKIGEFSFRGILQSTTANTGPKRTATDETGRVRNSGSGIPSPDGGMALVMQRQFEQFAGALRLLVAASTPPQASRYIPGSSP